MCDSMTHVLQGVFATMDYFQYIEIYHVDIQKLNYNAFFDKYFQFKFMRYDVR
jgi:hypothetical protein